MKELDEIRARLEAATPGPWEFNLGGDWEITANGGSLDYVASVSDHGAQSDHDAVFISSAPTDLARLLAAVEAVEALCNSADAADGLYRKIVHTRSIRATITAALTPTPVQDDE